MNLYDACRYMSLGACLASFLTFLLHVIAFATPNWIASTSSSPFISAGLVQACFSQCYHPYCPGDTSYTLIYNGCAGIYDEYFREIWKWLGPDWFLFVRSLGIALIPISFAGFLLLFICTCVSVSDNRKRMKIKGQICYVFLLASSFAVVLVTSVMMILSLSIFYSNAFHFKWMPMPEKNALSYSFWLEFVAALLSVGTAIDLAAAFAFKLLRNHLDKEIEAAEAAMTGIHS